MIFPVATTAGRSLPEFSSEDGPIERAEDAKEGFFVVLRLAQRTGREVQADPVFKTTFDNGWKFGFFSRQP